MNKSEALAEVLGLPGDEPSMVNVVTYKGTVYGVYNRYDDAYREATEKFGWSALAFCDANITRMKVQ